MADDWNLLVLGGIDQPRVLLLDENYIENNLFTSNDLSGWTESGGAVISRVENINAYNRYMAQVVYSSSSDYVEYVYDYGSSITDKTFFCVLNIIGSVKLIFNGDIEFGEVAGNSVSDILKCFIIKTATGISGNSISIRIYGVGVVLFDNIYFSEVLNDIILPQPHDSGKLIFNKEIKGESKLWTNKKQEYNVKFIPSYVANYSYLSVLNEKYRQMINESQNLFFIPHMDFNWGFFGTWNNDEFTRAYSFNQYDGHSGEVVIKGNEYFNQSDSGGGVIPTPLSTFWDVLVTAYVPE